MDFIEKQLIEQRIKNLKEFDINDDSIKLKIQGFATRYNLKESEVMPFIFSHAAALILGKDANKQNKHELYVYEYLKEFNINLTILKKNEKLLQNGNIVNYDKNIKSNIKTIDFIGTYKDYQLIVNHKYTKSLGGAQDNQFNDVIVFLNEATRGAHKKNNLYVCLLDGDYYRLKYKGYDNKIDFLKTEFPHKNIIICNTPQLPELLQDY